MKAQRKPISWPTETVAYKNLFLAALPPRDLALLRPALQVVELGRVISSASRDSACRTSYSSRRAWCRADHDAGRHGDRDRNPGPRIDHWCAVGDRRPSQQRARGRADHGSGWKIRAADFRAAVEKSRTLRHLVLLSSELAMAQMQQTAACNALHSAERRLCRWILQVRDRIDSDVIELTQDFLAQMLAVRRPTVTLIAQKPAERRPDPLPPRPHRHHRPRRAGEARLRMRRRDPHQDRHILSRAGLDVSVAPRRLVKRALPRPVPIVSTPQCSTSVMRGTSLRPCTTASLCITTSGVSPSILGRRPAAPRAG